MVAAMGTRLILYPVPFKLRPSIAISLRRSQPSSSATVTYLRKHSILYAAGSPDSNSGESSDADGTGSSGDTPNAATVRRASPVALNIRYRARSKRQAQKQKQQEDLQKSPTPPKAWEEMTIWEKGLELYVGEKGLLFWLNKFAYASIFFVIGGWILFRFVGPSLGFYQLDAPPLSPTSIFKDGSS